MQKKKIFVLSLAFIIIILVGLYFVFFKLNKKSVPEIKITQTETTNIKIEDKKISDSANPFKIDITYPEILGHNDFNALAKNIVDEEISDFKTYSLENDNAVKETDPENYAKYPREYELIISYDKGQVDNDIASIVFNIYSFEGGAHGSSYTIPLNYDFKNKKEIVLSDIFVGQKNYLQTISDYCIADLTNQIIASAGEEYTDKDWIKTGAGPIAENFDIFLINKDSVTFYFPQYQVAAYAYGDFKVTMPR